MQITKFTVFLLFGLSFVISLAATPAARWIAPRIGAMDIPKDSRRMHTHPIPRFGGMAMFLGTIIPILIFLHHHSGMMAAAVGGCMVYALGALDDLKNLSAKLKFTVELLIAALMYAMGLRIKLISNYLGGGDLHFGTAVCFIVTVLWIVGITNTINLVDGLDGLAAGVAMIAALTIAYVAYIHGNTYGMIPVCCAMISLAGSCAGFLPYNFYPASIFMGDSGSLFLGFMIASMSVVGPLKRSTVIAVVIPVIVLGVPIFDTFFAIVRRWVNHRPIMEADKGHLHHHLMASGFGQRRAVLMLYGISGIMGMAAVLVSRELIKDALVLMAIAGVYLYVFLTDPNHKLPHIKAVDTNREEKQQKRMEKWDPKEQQKYGEDFSSESDQNTRDS
ncbi:MAG: glycosyltransferase family 4 protein [Eubacterium sp.]